MIVESAIQLHRVAFRPTAYHGKALRHIKCKKHRHDACKVTTKAPSMATRKHRAPAQTSFLKSAPQIKNGDVLDVAEAAALLKVSKETVYKRVRGNAIPHARVGRRLLFHKQSLVQWVADGADRATSSGEDQQLSLGELLNASHVMLGMRGGGQKPVLDACLPSRDPSGPILEYFSASACVAATGHDQSGGAQCQSQDGQRP